MRKSTLKNVIFLELIQQQIRCQKRVNNEKGNPHRSIISCPEVHTATRLVNSTKTCRLINTNRFLFECTCSTHISHQTIQNQSIKKKTTQAYASSFVYWLPPTKPNRSVSSSGMSADTTPFATISWSLSSSWCELSEHWAMTTESGNADWQATIQDMEEMGATELITVKTKLCERHPIEQFSRPFFVSNDHQIKTWNPSSPIKPDTCIAHDTKVEKVHLSFKYKSEI